MAASAQPSSGNAQPLQQYSLQVPSVNNYSGSVVMKPAEPDAPLFYFDSLNVTYRGSWGFGQSFSMGTSASGTIKFVGSGAGVIILDVTDPANPVKVSELSTRGLVDAMCFDEATNRLYVTAYFAGFEIWDLSNMAAPVRIGAAPVDGLPRGGIFADGNYAWVVTVADGVNAYDVTTPSVPQLIGHCAVDPNNFAWNSAKAGDVIFVALTDGGMAMVDVSVPQSPILTETYSGNVYGVAVASNLAYVVSYSYGLRILDISDLSNITLKGSCSIAGFPYRIQVAGNYAYIGNTDNSAGGVNVVDITDPAHPALVSTYPGYAANIAAAGNTVAFTGSGTACTILDITDPAAPALANTYSIPNFVGDIFVDGNYAYTGNNGFRVIDISDKTHPVQVGYNVIDGSIVRKSGNNAVYIRESMTSNNPVMVMDVSDPANPALLGQYNSPWMTGDLELRDNYAFVACWWDGVRIVDFSDPAHPVLTSHTMGWTSGGTPGVTYLYAQALDVEANYLYILDYGPFSNEDTKGLYIVDISDISHPALLTRFTAIQSYGYDLDVEGDFVYIADNYGGLEIIDVTDKTNPVVCGYIGLPDGANYVKVVENMAFLADYINGGVQVVDVSNPYNPSIAGYYMRSGCFALALDVEGTDIYLADGAGGFQVYSTSLITGTKQGHDLKSVASASYPNPFRDELTIRVAAPFDPNNCLAIYNAAGSIVSTLMPAGQQKNETVYRWNGKSATGAAVCAGFYYYKTASGDACGKVVKAQ